MPSCLNKHYPDHRLYNQHREKANPLGRSSKVGPCEWSFSSLMLLSCASPAAQPEVKETGGDCCQGVVVISAGKTNCIWYFNGINGQNSVLVPPSYDEEARM